MLLTATSTAVGTKFLLNTYLTLAVSLQATTYGWGELYCGHPERPVACETGQPTSTGIPLNPWGSATAAIPLPGGLRLPPSGLTVHLRVRGRQCRPIRVVDLTNTRWVGVRGLDLTPAALLALGVEPRSTWSGQLEFCRKPRWKATPGWDDVSPDYRRILQ